MARISINIGLDPTVAPDERLAEATRKATIKLLTELARLHSRQRVAPAQVAAGLMAAAGTFMACAGKDEVSPEQHADVCRATFLMFYNEAVVNMAKSSAAGTA